MARIGPPGNSWTSARVITVTMNRTRIACAMRLIRYPSIEPLPFAQPGTPGSGHHDHAKSRAYRRYTRGYRQLRSRLPSRGCAGRRPTPLRLLGELPVLRQQGEERVVPDVLQRALTRDDLVRVRARHPDVRQLLRRERGEVVEIPDAAVGVGQVDELVHLRIGVVTRVG